MQYLKLLYFYRTTAQQIFDPTFVQVISKHSTKNVIGMYNAVCDFVIKATILVNFYKKYICVA